ncbi:MAG: hypothetical protein L0H94_00320 [Nitrospira sp.]|nr:hypothetical protein [Nitrospira sp.]
MDAIVPRMRTAFERDTSDQSVETQFGHRESERLPHVKSQDEEVREVLRRDDAQDKRERVNALHKVPVSQMISPDETADTSERSATRPTSILSDSHQAVSDLEKPSIQAEGSGSVSSIRLEEHAERRDDLVDPTIQPSHSMRERKQFVMSNSLSDGQEATGQRMRDQHGIPQAHMNPLSPMMDARDTSDRKSQNDPPSDFSERQPQLLPHQSGPLFELPTAQMSAEKGATTRETVPTIHVTIGRIEVRATQQTKSAMSHARQVSSVMTLKDYLRNRERGVQGE